MFNAGVTKRRYSVFMHGTRDNVRQLLIELIRHKIAVRAYELYQERGAAAGRELDDWLKAEEEILSHSISAPLYARRDDRAAQLR